jgi:hypothetical protein
MKPGRRARGTAGTVPLAAAGDPPAATGTLSSVTPAMPTHRDARRAERDDPGREPAEDAMTTHTDLPAFATRLVPLHERLEEHARLQPMRPAYLWYGRAISWAELDRLSDNFAARLSQLGGGLGRCAWPCS